MFDSIARKLSADDRRYSGRRRRPAVGPAACLLVPRRPTIPVEDNREPSVRRMIRTRAAMPRTAGTARQPLRFLPTSRQTSGPAEPISRYERRCSIPTLCALRARDPNAPVPASQPTAHPISQVRYRGSATRDARRTTTARAARFRSVFAGHRADHRLNPGPTSDRRRMCSR